MIINKEKSLRENIKFHFRSLYPKFVNGGEAENMAFELGKKPSNASRRCRELENDGILEREERRSEKSRVKSVWYRYIPTEHEKLSENMQKMLELENAKENLSPIKKETLGISEKNHSPKTQTLFHLREA